MSDKTGKEHNHDCSHDHGSHDNGDCGHNDHDHNGHDHNGHDHGEDGHNDHEHNDNDHNDNDHSGHDHGGHDHSHHGHGHHGHHHGIGSGGNKRALTIALIITAGIMLLEFFGGLWTNSLALLSDSGHMLSDTSAIALSLVAIWFAAKPASKSKTYGFYRFEILAALFNGVTLFVIAGFILWEAFQRFGSPPEVSGASMMAIAAVGLLANLVSAVVLARQGDVKGNVNLRSAYLHVLSDALGSVGAIAAGVLMWAFEWYWADPVISVLVSLLILKSAWSVILHTLHILMEGAPANVDREAVRDRLGRIEGVIDVHDLHIWTITSNLDSLSCHLLIRDEANSQTVLQEAIRLVEKHFKIHHTTIQIETSAIRHGELKV